MMDTRRIANRLPFRGPQSDCLIVESGPLSAYNITDVAPVFSDYGHPVADAADHPPSGRLPKREQTSGGAFVWANRCNAYSPEGLDERRQTFWRAQRVRRPVADRVPRSQARVAGSVIRLRSGSQAISDNNEHSIQPAGAQAGILIGLTIQVMCGPPFCHGQSIHVSNHR